MGVEDYLQSASRLGQLDSEGSFTIAGEAAVGKLAAFQLPRQSAWVLKIVQAAVTSGASFLEIRQSRDVTTFRFDPSIEIDVDAIEKSLLAVEIEATPFVRHLCVGLRTVGFGDKRAFTLAASDGEHRQLFGWNCHNLTKQTNREEEPTRPYLHLGVAFPEDNQGRVLGGMMRAAGRATDEYQEIVRYGQACPLKLTLDGRRLDTLMGLPEKIMSCTSVPLGICTLSALQSPHPKLPIPPGIDRVQTRWRPTDRFTDSRLFYFEGGQEQEAPALLRVCYHFHVDSHRSKYRSFQFHSVPQPSVAHWVKDGVICQSQTLSRTPSAASLDVFLSAEGLPTDISGLRLREVSEAPERLRLVLSGAPQFLYRTGEVVQGFTPRPFGVHTAMYGALGAFGVVCTPVTMGKGMWATMAAVGMAVSAYDKRKIMLDCQHALSHLAHMVPTFGLR